MRLALKVVMQNDGDFMDVILLYILPHLGEKINGKAMHDDGRRECLSMCVCVFSTRVFPV